MTRDRINAWLARFTTPDQDLAARILDAVEYITHDKLDAALQATLHRLEKFGWRIGTGRQGKWRFAAFSSSAGESGDNMLYKFRVANGLTLHRHKQLFVYKSELLKENLGPDDTVVFVDDISGSGKQATDHWSDLRELLPRGPRAFLVLVAVSVTARAKILADTKLRVIHHLGLKDADNVFSAECKHFTGGEKDTLVRYCHRADPKQPKGWKDCGFVIVFAHRCPNNSIPVLHARNARWEGLFER